MIEFPSWKKKGGRHTWFLLVQEITQVEQVSLNDDEEGHGQKHKDEHVYCKMQMGMTFKINK